MNTAEFLQISSMVVPDRDALVQGDMRITYVEMADRVKRLANGLQAMGIGKGSAVAVIANNSPRYVETYYAAATLGAVFVPLNNRAKQEELTYMLNTSKADVVFLGERYVPLFEEIRGTLDTVKHVVCFDAWPPDMQNYDNLLAVNPPDDIFTEIDDGDSTIMIFTSGTTAMPKGVALNYGGSTEYVLSSVEMADPAAEDVDAMLVSVPFFHIAGATTMMLAIYAGRKLVILPQFTPEGWLEAVQNEKVTISFVVPTMLKRIMEHPDFEKYDLSSLKSITYGAAPMPYEVVAQAVQVFTCDLNNAYGQTETNSTLTFLGAEDHRLAGLDEAARALKLKRLRSVGRPRDDVAIFIMDNDDNILGPNEEGEICVVSARVMSGYVGNEQATREAIHEDGMLHTGDVGYLDDDNYLFITGRKKDLIIRGGENISPGEIEAVLTSHPAIEEAAVIGVPDVEWGETVKAVVVPKHGHAAERDEIAAYVKSRLASFKVPQWIAFERELPRNAMGKVLKTDLRKTHGTPDHN